MHCRLTFLNVSKCDVTDKGAMALAQLIKGNKRFAGLFAHYNRIMGNGAGAIADAIAGSTSIQLLDLSFNSICANGKVQQIPDEADEKAKKPEKKKKALNADLKGVAGAFYEDYAEKWNRMFTKNKSLLHVDLSHNKIKATDCEIIAEGLRPNHSILGLHF